MTGETAQKGRDLFFGDLHGMSSMLLPLLESAGFRPGEDRLWSVGDFVDRGSNPLDAIRLLRDTPGCGAVLGNHDAQFLSWCRDPDRFADWHDDYGSWLSHYTPEEIAELADYLANLPLSRGVTLCDGRRVGLVHAQQPEGLMYAAPLRWTAEDAVDDGATTEAACSLWARSLALLAKHIRQDPRAQSRSIDDCYSALYLQPGLGSDLIDPRVDLVISGHTPFWNPPDPVLLGNHLFLDTLAFDRAGALTLVDPVNKVVWQQRAARKSRLSQVLPPATQRSWPEPIGLTGWQAKAGLHK